MANKINLDPHDKHASDRMEAERLDLDMHARLEVGLIETFSESDPVSAVHPTPTVEHHKPESLSFWQAIKTIFK
jgi:hypothetical protein